MTQEQFIQILPAYFGCRFTKAGFEYPAKLDGMRIYLAKNSMKNGVDYKLILRSFEQMTDEERNKRNEIYDATKGYQNMSGVVLRAAPLINYLRSIGIDCDGLIEAGYAIKEDAK